MKRDNTNRGEKHHGTTNYTKSERRKRRVAETGGFAAKEHRRPSICDCNVSQHKERFSTAANA